MICDSGSKCSAPRAYISLKPLGVLFCNGVPAFPVCWLWLWMSTHWKMSFYKLAQKNASTDNNIQNYLEFTTCRRSNNTSIKLNLLQTITQHLHKLELAQPFSEFT